MIAIGKRAIVLAAIVAASPTIDLGAFADSAPGQGGGSGSSLPPTWAVCVPSGTGDFVVDQHKTALWFAFQTNVADPNPEQLFAAGAEKNQWAAAEAKMNFVGVTDQKRLTELRTSMAESLGNDVSVVETKMGETPKSPSATYYGSDPDHFDVATWFGQHNQAGELMIFCNPNPRQTAESGGGGAAGAGGGAAKDAGNPKPERTLLRIRGTPDTLAVDQNDGPFAAADKATISFTDNGATKVRTDVFQGTLGVALFDVNKNGGPPINQNEDHYQLIPFVSTNRNVTNNPNKPAKFNTDYVEGGIVGAWTYVNQNFINTLSVSPDYEANYVDGSRLFYVHAVDQPYYLGLINDYLFPGQVPSNQGGLSPRFMIVADIRSDVGDYIDRGNTPAANRDFARLGSQFGGLLSVYSGSTDAVDIAVTHTYLHALYGVPEDINYFQTSATYNIYKNLVGLTASYQNGLLETTAKRSQQWTVSLTAKY